MRITTGKLKLARTTLRLLTSDALVRARGGWVAEPTPEDKTKGDLDTNAGDTCEATGCGGIDPNTFSRLDPTCGEVM
jgi:hypothetical protein